MADVLGKTGDSVKIYLLLEYIMSNESVKNKLKSTIKTGLAGLKIVSYYGCLMTRPPEAIRFDDVENPVIMDELVEILGGEPVDWAMKTECCGASLSLTKSNIVHNLVDKILDYAQRSGAEAIMTACPLCLLNLEMRRIGKYDIPVFYFTELIGITQKNPNLSKWLKYHLVDAFGTLRKKELI